MKKFFFLAIIAPLAIITALWSTVPRSLHAQANPGPPVHCTLSVIINTASAATTQLVAAVAGQAIHICGFIFQSAAATTGKLVSGTGVNCGTNTTDLTPPFVFTTTPHAVPFGNPVGLLKRATVSHALCVTNSQAQQLNGLVSYRQF